MPVFQRADLILLEGQKHSSYPKLETMRRVISTEPVCRQETVLAYVTDFGGGGIQGRKWDETPVYPFQDMDRILELCYKGYGWLQRIKIIKERRTICCHFESDYTEGAHEAILKRLAEQTGEQTPGYGADPYCEAAKEKLPEPAAARRQISIFLTGGLRPTRR